MSLKVVQLNRLPYLAALAIQNKLFHKIKQAQECSSSQACPDYLLLVEHEPVYTVGLRSREYQDDAMQTRLRALGADFVATNRGGLITFHGPGQLVAYPILNMSHFNPIGQSIKRFVYLLESIIMGTCADFNIRADRLSGFPGVWVDNDRKIAAIGVHASRFVTMHGLAINCDTDLAWFEHIVPCGIRNKSVTSITHELGKTVKIEQVSSSLLQHFSRHLECPLEIEDAAKLV